MSWRCRLPWKVRALHEANISPRIEAPAALGECLCSTFHGVQVSLNNKNSCTEGLKKVSELKLNPCAAVSSPLNRKLSKFVDHR